MRVENEGVGGGEARVQTRTDCPPSLRKPQSVGNFKIQEEEKETLCSQSDKTDKLTAGYASEMVANKPKLSHESEPFRKIPIL